MPIKSTEHSVSLRGERGFTLIEVMFGLLIFSIGILAIGILQITAIKGNSVARGNTEAATLAMDRVESLCSDYNDLSAGSDTSNANYNVTWTVDQDDVIVNTKTLSVTVAWIEDGQNRDLTLVRVVPKISS